MGTKKKTAKLCSKRSKFRAALKIVKKYWEARPDSECLSYGGIDPNCLEECENRTLHCVICIDVYRFEDYQFKVTSCTVQIGKICTYITSKYANCEEKHHATVSKSMEEKIRKNTKLKINN